MEHAPCISQIATLLADPKRSAMMWALMDGTARQTEELALLAGLSPSSASAHLGRLSAGGLLRVEIRGRKRFFRLAAPEVGAAIEALASATLASTPREVPDVFKRPNPIAKPQTAPSSLLRARLCDDHLGGTLAADLYQRLLDAGWIEQIDQRVMITHKGSTQLATRGVFIQALAHRNCLSRLERKTPAHGRLTGRGAVATVHAVGLVEPAQRIPCLADHCRWAA